MATKKPIKAKAPKFDLSKVDLNQNQQMIAELVDMKATPGWRLLMDVLKGNIAVLEDEILSGVEYPSGKKLDANAIDLKRALRMARLELLSTPEVLVKRLDATTKNEISDDPYFTEMKEGVAT